MYHSNDPWQNHWIGWTNEDFGSRFHGVSAKDFQPFMGNVLDLSEPGGSILDFRGSTKAGEPHWIPHPLAAIFTGRPEIGDLVVFLHGARCWRRCLLP